VVSIPEKTPRIAGSDELVSVPDPLSKGTESIQKLSPESTTFDLASAQDESLQSQDSIDLQENQKVASGEATLFDEICSDSAEIIKNFYEHLDTQEYMQVFGLKTSSEIHFTKLIQKLIDNPPIVSGEMNDLYAILQNTAHFFRLIGKENILVIKGILDQEKDKFENVLSHFYSLLHTPACPQESFALRVQAESLYDYAGFFLSTMGGRLYMFRRDSMSRMVVSYYAILLVDKANKNASNRHGIEIKTAIDQLITEMESTSNTLQLQDTYLDKLYTLKEEYQ